MAQTYSKPTKPTGCFGALGIASNDCATPQASEVRMLIISNALEAGGAAHGPSGDVSLPASWTGVIDNATADKARKITGAGDIPAAPETTVIANGAPHPIAKERTLNFDMVLVGTETEELMRTLQYGYKGYIWPITRGGKILGGDTGIHAVCTYAEPDYPRGNESVKVWKTKWVWYELISPPEAASPFPVFN